MNASSKDYEDKSKNFDRIRESFEKIKVCERGALLGGRVALFLTVFNFRVKSID